MRGQAAPVPAWGPVLVLIGAMVLLQAAGLAPALRLERGAVADGQVWRLLTAHFVHLGWAHLALNAAGVLLCGALAPALFARPGLLALQLAVLGLGVSLGLLLAWPGPAHYLGLSGVLYGLFVLGLAPQARRGDLLSLAALLLVLGWGAWQLLAGTSADEERLIGGRIVAPAHAWGMVAAGLWLAGDALRGRRRPGT